jgi:hypothetical protein
MPMISRGARELAMLICSSEQAVEAFISFYEIAARDLLMPTVTP